MEEVPGERYNFITATHSPGFSLIFILTSHISQLKTAQQTDVREGRAGEDEGENQDLNFQVEISQIETDSRNL